MSAPKWTDEQKLLALLELPWSIAVSQDPADGSLIAEVGEIPDAIATGNTEKDLAIDLWESLKASLAIRLEHGDAIQLPPSASELPWLSDKPPRAREEVTPVLGTPLSLATVTVSSSAVATVGI